MTNLFAVIGISVCWFVFWMIFLFVLNLKRSQHNKNLNDEHSAFWLGLATGPLAFLVIFNHIEIARGRAGARIWGGIFGVAGIYFIYSSIFDRASVHNNSDRVLEERPIPPTRGASLQREAPIESRTSPRDGNSNQTFFDIPRTYSVNWSQNSGDWVIESVVDFYNYTYCVAMPRVENPPIQIRKRKNEDTIVLLWRRSTQEYTMHSISVGFDNRINYNLPVNSLLMRNIVRNEFYFTINIDQNFLRNFRDGTQMTINGHNIGLRGSSAIYNRLLRC